MVGWAPRARGIMEEKHMSEALPHDVVSDGSGPGPSLGMHGSGRITDALGGEDPLDSESFDAVAYLNLHFPTERSLERLDPFVTDVSAQIEDLDGAMSEAVQSQSEGGQQAAKDVNEAKAAIVALFGKIRDIKAKAEQSEVMVQEICRDIRQLDHAKRHLVTTITALKRLHMLVTAVDQLKQVAGAKQYGKAAELLDAVRQLLTHFEGYASVPRIAELWSTVAAIKKDLSGQIHDAFNAIGQLAASTADPEGFSRGEADVPGQFRNLHEACLVVDALGTGARMRQVRSFCERQLDPYARLFPVGSTQASLEEIDRRFAWFRRLLRSVDAQFEGVFPAHWRVQHSLCLLFLERTRTSMLAILEESQQGGGGGEQYDVQALLKALQKCLSFEKEATARFTEAGGERAVAAARNVDSDGNALDPNSAEAIKKKYRMMGEKKVMDASAPKSKLVQLSRDGQGAQDDDDESAFLMPIVGSLSAVFDPFMGPYIEMERRELAKLMGEAQSSGEMGTVNGKLPVFGASVNVFANIKNSMKRCTGLTTGQTFFKLYKEFKSCLGSYAKALMAKLPASTNGQALGTPQYRLKDGVELDVCYTVNTADYCAETLPQLEEVIRSKIDASYRDTVDLGPERELFYDVVGKALQVLHGGLEMKMDPAFRAMSSINWGACEMVGEESGYVRAAGEIISKFVPTVRGHLSALYFRTFCDKFANSFLPAYLGLLLRQRHINEMGTQQLLLDVYNLKTLMLKLPALGIPSSEAPPIPISYTKYVTKKMSKIEMVLKLVGTPDGMLVERFQIMWPDGVAQDLVSIMQLKGMRKSEQQAALDALGLEGVPSGGSPERDGRQSEEPSAAGRANPAKMPASVSAFVSPAVSEARFKSLTDNFQRLSSGFGR